MEAKEEAKKLIAERDKLDAEIEDNLSILAKNGCTMDSPLVDEEGYPFSHIDIYSVREARHTIICLRNDRKALTEKIMNSIEKSHAEDRLQISKLESPCEGIEEASVGCCRDISEVNEKMLQEFQPKLVHRTSNKPFLKVTKVMPNSPAANGGLKADDLIIQYGDLHAGNFKDIKEVASTTAKYEGEKLCVTALRNGRAARLEIYPERWSGSGILGCGIIPLSTVDLI